MRSDDAKPRRGPRRFGARLQQIAHGALLAAFLAIAPLTEAQDLAAPQFEIRRFSVEGNTVLADSRIDATLAPFTGSARSFADLQAAVAALQQAYARAGFATVSVSLPEQEVASGTVHIAVLEARLRAVTVNSPAPIDAESIRRSLPSLQTGATPNTDELAREIRLANENPTRRISVDLQADAPGQIDARISVLQDKPWKMGVVLDDTGTPATGRGRIGAFFQHANVADLAHVATLQYVTSPDRPGKVTIGALNYRIPLPSLGDSIDLFGVYADVDSGVVSDLFNVRGSGTVAGLRYNHNLSPTASYQHRWLYGIEHRRVDNRIGLVGGSADLVPDVTLLPASIGYAATWTGAGRQLDFSATGVRNIPGGAHGSAAALEAARAGASARYTILRYTVTGLQTLPADWQMRVALDGQYTRDALVPGEQFGVGGQDSVRGFDERELANDIGNRATLEFHGPDVGERLGPGVSARALVFIDQGWTRRNHPLPGERVATHVSSVGVGIRLSLPPSWQLRVDAAHVTQGAGSRPRGDERLHCSIGYAY